MKNFCLSILLVFSSSLAFAQEGFIGEIRLFSGNFAPRSWSFCDGQILPINQNQALFSILGTTYGGDGRTTFALPKLKGPILPNPADIIAETTSDKGRQQVQVSFQNTSNDPVRVEWLDIEGKAQNRGILAPGKSLVESTTPGSVWQFLIDGVVIRRLKANQDLKQAYQLRAPQRMRYIICINGIYPSRS